MSFAIEFTSSTPHSPNSSIGRIIFPNATDYFEAFLFYWSEDDYRSHWRRALSRLVDGHERSALITDMYDPEHANFITWWPMWRIGNQIYVHNQFLFMDELPEPFDVSRYFDFVDERETESEEGNKISEWVVPLEAVTNFLSSA